MSTTLATLDPQAFQFITTLVRERSAIVLEEGKSYLIESRLSPIAREQGLESVAELVSVLRKPGQQQLAQRVVEAMTTNESSFFRDLHPFQALKTTILPALIESRKKERTLNIWSNACSSGQEIYSIALTIKEHFPELSGWKVRLIGTDLSTQILERAKLGIFNQTEVNRGLPMPLLLKYFVKEGIHWKIKEEIRQMADFRILNLVEPFPAYLPEMDLVFLRNVLIYFSPESKRQILFKTHKILRDDGYLFLGGAETTMNLDVTYAREQVGNAVWYRPTQPNP